MSDSEASSTDVDIGSQSNNVKLVNILKEHTVIFNKSQVPNIKNKKEAAFKEIHRKYLSQTGHDISVKQVKKKIQNMKNEVKKKVDKRATGNKPIHLKDWEKLLTELLDVERNPVFEKVPGARTAGVEVATSSSSQVPLPPPLPPKTNNNTTTSKKRKFNETEETSSLSTTELQRLVLLEQLELIRMQKEREKILLAKLEHTEPNNFHEQLCDEAGLHYTVL